MRACLYGVTVSYCMVKTHASRIMSIVGMLSDTEICFVGLIMQHLGQDHTRSYLGLSYSLPAYPHVLCNFRFQDTISALGSFDVQ